MISANKLKQKDIKKLVEIVINLTSLTNRHPYNILRETVAVFGLNIEDSKMVVSDCEDILKSKRKELPWTL